MTEFLDFAARHWFLFAALFVIIGLIVGNELMLHYRGIKGLSPQQALQLINRDDALLLDVRDNGDYRSAHLREAINIPAKELSERTKELNKYRNRPIIVYCQSGGARASESGQILKKAGFEQVMSLKGGLLAWQNENLPVQKTK